MAFRWETQQYHDRLHAFNMESGVVLGNVLRTYAAGNAEGKA